MSGLLKDPALRPVPVFGNNGTAPIDDGMVCTGVILAPSSPALWEKLAVAAPWHRKKKTLERKLKKIKEEGSSSLYKI